MEGDNGGFVIGRTLSCDRCCVDAGAEDGLLGANGFGATPREALNGRFVACDVLLSGGGATEGAVTGRNGAFPEDAVAGRTSAVPEEALGIALAECGMRVRGDMLGLIPDGCPVEGRTPMCCRLGNGILVPIGFSGCGGICVIGDPFALLHISRSR